MQGLADGYFVLSDTIRDYLADGPFDKVPEDHPAVIEAQASVRGRIEVFLSMNGTRSVDSYHRELGHIMVEYCGMERTADGLRKAIDLIRGLRADFWRNLKVLGTASSLNQSLEKAGRVADFLELGELMCMRCTDGSRAAGTSAPSPRPRTVRRCATTRTTPTSPPGSGAASTGNRSCTRKISSTTSLR